MASKSKYEVQSALGQGGMGAVYRAVHKELKRPCALKVLKPELVAHAGARKRFEREVQVMAGLNHPNIVRIFDAGVSPRGCYMAMELVPGQSLDRIIKAKGALPLEEALAVGDAILQALAYIHERGVVHRDLKPANVMVTDEGQVKVMDFGLVFVDDRTRLTKTGEAVGTIRYMPPETLRGVTSDGRSDLYQWAAIFFECLTGRYFCDGKTQGELVLQILEGECPSARSLRPELPEALDRVIAWAGARDPEARPSDAGSLRKALLQVSRRGSGLADLSRTVTDLPPLEELGLPSGEAFELSGDSSLAEGRGNSAAFRRPSSAGNRRPAPVSGGSRKKLWAGAASLLALGLVLGAWLYGRSGIGGRPPRLDRLRAEPFLCRVSGRHVAGAPVPWRVSHDGRVIRKGRVSAGADGTFEITVRGLDDGEAYLFHLGEEGSMLQGRRFRTEPFRIVEGPWARTGPKWLDVRWKANAPCVLEVTAKLMRSKQQWEGRRTSKEVEEGRVDFTAVTFDQAPASRLRVTLLRDRKVLRRGDVSLAVRDILRLPRCTDKDEPLAFAKGSAVVGNTAVFADVAGLVYGIDLRQVFTLPPPEELQLAWIEAVTARPAQERAHARFRFFPACGGCVAWKDRVVVLANRPPSLHVFLPSARAARFEKLAVEFKGRSPVTLLQTDLASLDPVLVDGLPERAEGEYVLSLDVKGSALHGALVDGDRLYVAYVEGNSSELLAVDLRSREIVGRMGLPAAIVATPVLAGSELLLVGRVGKKHWLRAIDRDSLAGSWQLPLADAVKDRPWIDPKGGRYTFCDGTSFYCLKTPGPSSGLREVDEAKGEWKVAAREALSAPRPWGGRWWVPTRAQVKRFFEMRGIPVLASFMPGEVDDDWRVIELPAAMINRYTDVQIHDLGLEDGLFTFLYDFDCFAVRLPGGECEWISTSGNRPDAPPRVADGILFNAHQSGNVWALPLRTQRTP